MRLLTHRVTRWKGSSVHLLVGAKQESCDSPQNRSWGPVIPLASVIWDRPLDYYQVSVFPLLGGCCGMILVSVFLSSGSTG